MPSVALPSAAAATACAWPTSAAAKFHLHPHTPTSTAESPSTSSAEEGAPCCHDAAADDDHDADGAPVFVKRVALVGSSGGGAAAQG